MPKVKKEDLEGDYFVTFQPYKTAREWMFFLIEQHAKYVFKWEEEVKQVMSFARNYDIRLRFGDGPATTYPSDHIDVWVQNDCVENGEICYNQLFFYNLTHETFHVLVSLVQHFKYEKVMGELHATGSLFEAQATWAGWTQFALLGEMFGKEERHKSYFQRQLRGKIPEEIEVKKVCCISAKEWEESHQSNEYHLLTAIVAGQEDGYFRHMFQFLRDEFKSEEKIDHMIKYEDMKPPESDPEKIWERIKSEENRKWVFKV